MLKKLKKADNFSVSKFEALQTNGVLISIILFISLAVYSNALFNGFVFDDITVIVDNTLIRDTKNIPAIFTNSAWNFGGMPVVSNYYRPLMNIIYMFDYYIFGLTPWSIHLINILFQSGVSVLVFIITKNLLRGPSQRPASSLPAFMAALLFATHPIHTEAVATGVTELSFTFFFLLSFLLYIRAREG